MHSDKAQKRHCITVCLVARGCRKPVAPPRLGGAGHLNQLDEELDDELDDELEDDGLRRRFDPFFGCRSSKAFKLEVTKSARSFSFSSSLLDLAGMV